MTKDEALVIAALFLVVYLLASAYLWLGGTAQRWIQHALWGGAV